jgi:hypothetical protein
MTLILKKFKVILLYLNRGKNLAKAKNALEIPIWEWAITTFQFKEWVKIIFLFMNGLNSHSYSRNGLKSHSYSRNGLKSHSYSIQIINV